MTDDPDEPRPDPRTVMLRIRAAMPSLRPSERRVAEFLLDQPLDAATLSISTLADRCATSSTSVVRFCRRLGYRHYKDVQIDLTREATREGVQNGDFPALSGDIDRRDSLRDIVSKVERNERLSIADTGTALDLGELKRAADLVDRARRVDSFGVGASSLVGLDLQQKLSRIGRSAMNWPDPHAAWTSAATLDSTCVAIGLSHSCDAADTVDFLRFAHDAGAHTVGITNFDGSPLADTADVVLTTAARETPFRSGALGSRIAQLMVIDCLFIAVAQLSFDQSMSALRSTYAAVHRRNSSG
ncbi:MurR/RpiR family transcriptional regulator [soil metagenome]